jgi:hypothetical protein
MHEDYLAAQETGTVDLWIDMCTTKLTAGKALVARLFGLALIPPPSDRDEICDIWRQSFELLMVVQGGVSCLEIFLDCLPGLI